MPEIAPETPLRALRSQEPETTRVLEQLGVNGYRGDRAVVETLEGEDLDPDTALRMIEACLEEDACPPKASDGLEWTTQKIDRHLSTRQLACYADPQSESPNRPPRDRASGIRPRL